MASTEAARGTLRRSAASTRGLRSRARAPARMKGPMMPRIATARITARAASTPRKSQAPRSRFSHTSSTRRRWIRAVGPENLFTLPRLWSFLAYFDRRLRTFRDPVFVVPATVLHSLGVPIARDRIRIEVYASMEPESKDQWAPFRTSVNGIGQRIEE